MKGLPQGWRVAAIGEVAETALGKMLDRGRPRGLPLVPYLRNVNVQWGHIDTSDLRTMELADDERPRFGVQAGDLLVCEGGEIGRAAVWRGRGEFLAYQKALHRIRPGPQLDSVFLRYVLEHLAGTGTLERHGTGSTIDHLPQQNLRAVQIPLPPLPEQRRIVDILEHHLSRLDAAARSLKTVARRMDHLVRHDVESAIASRKAPVVPLESVIARPLSNGRSVPTADVGFPVLRLTALRGDEVDLTERKVGRWDAAAASRFVVEPGDFLLSRGNGSIELVARGALVPEVARPVAYPDTMIRVRLNDRVLPEYFNLVWNSPLVRRQIVALVRTTAGIYKINQRQLRQVQIALPTIEHQALLVCELVERRTAYHRLTSTLARIEARGQVLRRHLLAAAVSGELAGRRAHQGHDRRVGGRLARC